MAKVGANEPPAPERLPVSFAILDNTYLTDAGVRRPRSWWEAVARPRPWTARRSQLDALVNRNEWSIYVAQVKEKYGTLRFYVDVLDAEGLPYYADSCDDVSSFYKLVNEMESETGRVCCYCGTRENVRCYGGWIHYACPSCEARRCHRLS
ncbi:MAG: hypothetical protein J6D54_03250 [Olsenella sp.]|nr:hypothetical protein [Olsenella sp.]